MTILVVDDDPHTRALHSHFLRKAGYRVLTAASAMEAFDLLRLNEAVAAIHLDLILMDLRMPEIDGLEACRRIRASAAYRRVPVVFITASDPEESELDAYDSGAVDYLTKPVFKDKLLERAATLIEMKQKIDQSEHSSVPVQEEPLIDELTGLASRRRLDAELAKLWPKAAQSRSAISLVVLDVDCLKSFVERCGRAAADTLLKRLAATLTDAAGEQLVCRYAAEELAVLLPDAEPAAARAIAARLRDAVGALAAEYAAAAVTPALAASLGVATARPEQGGTPEGLTVLADGAVDCAQSAGRNQVAAVELVV